MQGNEEDEIACTVSLSTCDHTKLCLVTVKFEDSSKSQLIKTDWRPEVGKVLARIARGDRISDLRLIADRDDKKKRGCGYLSALLAEDDLWLCDIILAPN